MILISCIDENNGILFNGRRQSKDRNLMDVIRALSEKSGIYISDFSKDLFDEYGVMYSLCADPAELDTYDLFFSESGMEFRDMSVPIVILFRWDRIYPSDRYLGIDMKGYAIRSRREMKGYSHEKIMIEVYTRR